MFTVSASKLGGATDPLKKKRGKQFKNVVSIHLVVTTFYISFNEATLHLVWTQPS